MKAIVSGALAIVVLVLVFSPAMAQDKPWFDTKNCDFCKQFANDPQLLENMIWEYHDISNGLMIITAVKPEFKASYLAAQEGMQKVAQEMAQGKQGIQMCEHCRTYGALMMSGVKFEHVPAGVGDIMLMTSEKPELLAQIKDFAARSREGQAKMGKKE